MNLDFLGEYNMNRCMDLLTMQMQKSMTAGVRNTNNNKNSNDSSFQNMLSVKEIKSMMESSREEIKEKAASRAAKTSAPEENSLFDNYAFLSQYLGNSGFF